MLFFIHTEFKDLNWAETFVSLPPIVHNLIQSQTF